MTTAYLALGATAAGLARPFLIAARADRAGEAVGAPSAAALGTEHLR